MRASATLPVERPAPLSFGGHTLEDMMRALNQLAQNEAIGLEALEIWAAADPHHVKADCIREVQRVAGAVVATRALLLALLPHEAELHALVYRDTRA